MPVVAFPSRPKLEGRIGSIKAQKLKPKRIILGRIRPKRPTGQGDQNLQAIPESNRQRRRGGSRGYDEQKPETTVRRNRRYRGDRPTNNSSPRRLRRNQESVAPPRERSQPNVRSTPQNAPPSTLTPQSPPTKSWRSRLKPVERPPNNPPAAAPQTNPTPGFGSDG